MKSKKIIVTMLAVCALVTTSAISASAASIDQNSPESIGTEWTFELKNDPTYTVTIPSAVTLSKNGTQVDITAENVANLDCQRISVTIAGTDAYRNQMVLEGKDSRGISRSLRYSITTSDGEYIETTLNTTAVGKELASFTEDGTVSFTAAPIIAAASTKGVTYTGSMTYGIELVDIAQK